MKIAQYNLSEQLFVILVILFIASMYIFVNLFRNLIFRRENLHYTSEEYIEYIKFYDKLSYISWFSYLFFFIILIYLNFTQTKNYIYKIVFTFIFVFLIYLPIFPIVNLINVLLNLLLDNKPFLKDMDKEFPEHTNIKNHYQNIKSEFNNYKNKIDCFRDNNPLLGKIDTIDEKNNYCWRTLYLKKTGKIIEEQVEYFPKTMEVLKNEQIHNAFFSILDPKVEIKPHYGYYKGYLRYHLGINIPEENGKRPYIICGGEKHEWKEGEDVIFDDMYLHYVNNPTNGTRVILYLDIKRGHLNMFTNTLTYLGDNLIENSFILNFFIKNQHVQDKIKTTNS